MTRDDASWLNICYVVFTALIGYLLFRTIETVGIQTGWGDRYDSWYPYVEYSCAIIIGVASTYWLRSSADRREYHLASIGEVKKVTWPTVPDTKRMTTVVVIVVAIFSVILSVFDLVWSHILQLILP